MTHPVRPERIPTALSRARPPRAPRGTPGSARRPPARPTPRRTPAAPRARARAPRAPRSVMRTRRARASWSATATSTMPSSASWRTNWPQPWVVMSTHSASSVIVMPSGGSHSSTRSCEERRSGACSARRSRSRPKTIPISMGRCGSTAGKPVDSRHESNLPFLFMKATFTPGPVGSHERGELGGDDVGDAELARIVADLWRVPAVTLLDSVAERVDYDVPSILTGARTWVRGHADAGAGPRAVHALRQARAPLAALPRLRLRPARDRGVGRRVGAVARRAAALRLRPRRAAPRRPHHAPRAEGRRAGRRDRRRVARGGRVRPGALDRRRQRPRGRACSAGSPGAPGSPRSPGSTRSRGTSTASWPAGSPSPCCPACTTTPRGGTQRSPSTSATSARASTSVAGRARRARRRVRREPAP